VRKKLRRKPRQDSSVQAAPPPPPLPTPEPEVPHMPVLEGSTAALPFVHMDITKTEIGATRTAAQHAASTAPARQLRHALRPENLRHQFILTELLQPPKALRQEI
jgi:hypothetical protein